MAGDQHGTWIVEAQGDALVLGRQSGRDAVPGAAGVPGRGQIDWLVITQRQPLPADRLVTGPQAERLDDLGRQDARPFVTRVDATRLRIVAAAVARLAVEPARLLKGSYLRDRRGSFP